jgi:hypothetical protein
MSQPPVNPERLLAEIEDLLQSTPARATIRHQTDETLDWFGRAAAIVDLWNSAKSQEFSAHLALSRVTNAIEAARGMQGVMTMVRQVRHDLRIRTTGPINIAIGQGQVFADFDNLRKIIATATSDLFFVDQYLDADFVSNYLPHAAPGIAIRLLTSPRMISGLLPAVNLFSQQSGQAIAVRTAKEHDRFVLIDKRECYQSGASIKDGARNALTTLTQITDAFAAVSGTYEAMWNGATVHR